MKQLAALYRSPRYSPNQHRDNDTAILDAVVARFAALGWKIWGTTEQAVEAGEIPAADCYLNMCQGARATLRLLEADLGDTVLVNHPKAVLNCHRHWLVPALVRARLPFPPTLVLDVDEVTDTALAPFGTDPATRLWIKRGDVHAEIAEDVVASRMADVAQAVRAFVERGVRTVAIQAHVPGPIVKFYAVAGRPGHRFFRWFFADPADRERSRGIDEIRLEELAFAAADVLGLEVFGGDAALPTPETPVLIDINDWPSFAPVREEAADAIALHCHHFAMAPHRRSPTP